MAKIFGSHLWGDCHMNFGFRLIALSVGFSFYQVRVCLFVYIYTYMSLKRLFLPLCFSSMISSHALSWILCLLVGPLFDCFVFSLTASTIWRQWHLLNIGIVQEQPSETQDTWNLRWVMTKDPIHFKVLVMNLH